MTVRRRADSPVRLLPLFQTGSYLLLVEFVPIILQDIFQLHALDLDKWLCTHDLFVGAGFVVNLYELQAEIMQPGIFLAAS